MALIKAQTLQGFSQLPALRQLGLMAGLAASVALGVAIVLWAQTPNYTVLFSNLPAKNTSQVIESLQKINIRFKLDQKTGALMVPTSDMHQARIHLAKEGLPQNTSMGMEFLNKEDSFKTSKFTQYHRYIRAQEIELSRTIMTMRGIQRARVHLAIPEKSAFIGRSSSKPKATVMLSLYGGRRLSFEQVKAIVHMVSSSISDLENENVSVVDQHGKLLSRRSKGDNLAMSETQFEYKSQREHAYVTRIEDIISPIVGDGRVRAKVDVDLDFTQSEQTRESYNPDFPAVRSESITEQKNDSGNKPFGVPGAKSNQPPATGALKKPAGNERPGSSSNSGSRSVTRNYMPDKTISHIKSPVGNIRRLSIAVLVDDKRRVDDQGEVTKTPLSKLELEQITELVKSAVGFDEKRGDSIKVQNASFYTPPPPETIPDTPLLEKPWVWNLAKQAAGAIAVLILLFAVLRPVMKSLAEKADSTPAGGSMQAYLEQPVDPANPASPGPAQLANPNSRYDQQLTIAKNMVGQDPGRVAQVVKNWVASDG